MSVHFGFIPHMELPTGHFSPPKFLMGSLHTGRGVLMAPPRLPTDFVLPLFVLPSFQLKTKKLFLQIEINWFFN